jgi:hypothetical protein
MPRRVPVPDDFGHRPFTLADAKRIGLGSAFVRGSLFRRVFRGVYIRAEVPDTPTLRFDAACHLTHHPIWATCHTAAEIIGVPVPAHPLTHAGLPPGADGPDRVGIAAHRHDGQPVTQTVKGRRVAADTDVFLQLAGYLDLVDLVIVGDALVRLGRVTPEELIEAADTASGRGVRLARRAASLVRERVDSPMETRVRLLLVLGGLPEPETNVDVVDAVGCWLARPDLSYPKLRIAIEYDGAEHLRKSRRDKDIRRREAYDRELWRVLVIVDRDVFWFPAQTLFRVWVALQERRHPDVPRVLSDAWRPHFDPRMRRDGQNSPSARAGR